MVTPTSFVGEFSYLNSRIHHNNKNIPNEEPGSSLSTARCGQGRLPAEFAVEVLLVLHSTVRFHVTVESPFLLINKTLRKQNEKMMQVSRIREGSAFGGSNGLTWQFTLLMSMSSGFKRISSSERLETTVTDKSCGRNRRESYLIAIQPDIDSAIVLHCLRLYLVVEGEFIEFHVFQEGSFDPPLLKNRCLFLVIPEYLAPENVHRVREKVVHRQFAVPELTPIKLLGILKTYPCSIGTLFSRIAS